MNTSNNFFHTASDTYGSAGFMPFGERIAFLNRFNKGLVIDGRRRISRSDSYMHLLLAAPSGGGKTSRYIVPNLLRLTRQSAVVFDPSGEIFALSRQYLKRKGYGLKIFNPTDTAVSQFYNPLRRIHNHTDIRKLCDILIAAAFPHAGGSDAFWNDAAKGIIELLIRIVLKLPKDRQHLKEVFRLLNRIETDTDSVNRLAAEHLDEDGFEQYKAFIASEQKLKNSILSTARTALGKLSDPDIARLTSKETLEFETLRTEKTVLFLQIEESETEYYAFLLTILYTQLFGHCLKMPEKGKPYLPIFFFLDEFANSGKIPGFEQLITVLRKRKVSLSVILQDLRQLEGLYGKPASETVIANCASRIFFPGLSLESCEHVERLLGKSTRVQGSASRFASFNDKNTKEIGRALMTAQEIRTMKDRAIFVHGNRLPIKIRPRPWFKSFILKNRTK